MNVTAPRACLKGILLIKQEDGSVRATGPRTAKMLRGVFGNQLVVLKESSQLTDRDWEDLETMKQSLLQEPARSVEGDIVFLEQLADNV